MDESEPQDYEEAKNEGFRDLTHNLMELAVHCGLIGAVMSQYPEHVQVNWVDRLKEMNHWANAQIEEVQEFGTAFDE